MKTGTSKLLAYHILLPRSLKTPKSNDTYMMLSRITVSIDFGVFRERGNNTRYRSNLLVPVFTWKPYFKVYFLAITISKHPEPMPAGYRAGIPTFYRGDKMPWVEG